MHLNAVEIVCGEDFTHLFYEFLAAVSDTQTVDVARLHADDMTLLRFAL